MEIISIVGIDLAKNVFQIHAADPIIGDVNLKKWGHEVRLISPQFVRPTDQRLSGKMKELVSELYEELIVTEKRLSKYDDYVDFIYRNNEKCQRLGSIPGIGPITATALEASVGDFGVFKKGREFSAWLGLVPRQRSTG